MYQTFYISGKLRKDLILFMNNEVFTQTKKYFSRLGLAYFSGSLIIIAGQTAVTGVCAVIDPSMAISNYNLYFVILMLSMYLIFIPITAFLISKMQKGDAIPKRSMTFGQWLIAFLIAYAATYAANIVGTIITQLIGTIKGAPVTNALGAVLTDLNPFVAFFITVICAPVAEELLFRKLLIERTIRYGEGISVVISGLLFGLFHGNLNQFAYAFLLGCLFGFIFVKTGKIQYTIAMHMLINFLGSIVSMLILRASGLIEFMEAYMDPEADITALTMQHLSGIGIFMIYALILIGFTITGIILFAVNIRRFTLIPTELSVPKGWRFKTYILNVGILLFSALWIAQIVIQLFQ